MRQADLEYITDSILIEKYMAGTIIPLKKEAGIADVLLSIGNSIKEEVERLWDPEHPLLSIAKFTLTGAVTIFTPWWMSLIYFVCTEILQMDFSSVFESIKERVISHINSNNGINNSAISSIVDQVLPGGSAADDQKFAASVLSSEHVFKKVATAYSILEREAMDNWGITRLANLNANINKEAGIFSSALKAVIKAVVSKPVGGSFISKLLKFVFKTICISIGFRIAGKVGRKILPDSWTGNKDNGKSSDIGTSHTLHSEGFGEEHMPDIWAESVPLSNIDNAVADWAIKRYPQLAQAKSQLLQSDSFKAVLKEIKDSNDRNFYPNTTFIPHRINNTTINSKAELVDLFVGETAKKLKL